MGTPARAEDLARFEQIMRQHNRMLFRTARAILCDGGEAEDALQEAYLQACHALPDAYRAVFMLRAVEEMSVGETAAVLGIPEATVRSRFFRAKSLLRQVRRQGQPGEAEGPERRRVRLHPVMHGTLVVR